MQKNGQRIGKLLLAIALGASLPAMAMAQRGNGDPDRNGNQREDRHPGGGGEHQRPTPPQAQRPPQQQPQQFNQQARRPERPPQDFSRDRGPQNFGGQMQPRGDDRARFDNRRVEDRRIEDRRFDGRPGDGRPGDGRPPVDPRRFDNGGRPAYRVNDRWVGNNWRQDQRYDWRSYRDYNREQFHVGRYIAPRGWAYGYRRYGIGSVLPSLLWGSSFWLGDPWDYRLPPAYPPYRWVRYYDDVLLIDTRTGRIVDSIPDFFW